MFLRKSNSRKRLRGVRNQMGRNLTSGGTSPNSTLHGYSHNNDWTRHCIQVNRESTSIGFPHGGCEGSCIAPYLSFFVVSLLLVCLGVFFSSTYLSSPKLLWSWVKQCSLSLNFLFSSSSLLQVCSIFLTLFFLLHKSFRKRRPLRVWQILLSSPFVLCGFFLSLISFCCKQHLCTLDKLNNHDSVYNPYWAVFCFILPIKISTQHLMSREGPDSSYRNSNQVEEHARGMKELLCHVGLRTSVCAPFNMSTFFVTLSTSGHWEASFHNYASPFTFSFISWERWLFLPGAFTARCPPAPVMSLA